jgi:predicted dehydrogenase
MGPLKHKHTVGLIGCGNISSIYLKNTADLFDHFEIVAVADLVTDRAKARAQEFSISRVLEVEELLASSDIEIVLNLTIPQAHHAVAKAALEAGKHVYGEKPLSISLDDGEELVSLARKKELLLGGAPDTFLGAGIQTCLKLIRDGWIGRPLSATAFLLLGGHESWHPDPGFFYLAGGGPMFDMGPYYLTALVTLLGPVVSVAGMTSQGWKERVVASQPQKGAILPVEIPTHVSGLLAFAGGALATIVTSFDVKGGSTHPPLEIYGTEGSLQVPDPNTFGGPVRYRRAGQETWNEVPLLYGLADNSRGIGLSDLADALDDRRPARASGDLTLHVLEIMHGIHRSAETKTEYRVKNLCDQPLPLERKG